MEPLHEFFIWKKKQPKILISLPLVFTWKTKSKMWLLMSAKHFQRHFLLSSLSCENTLAIGDKTKKKTFFWHQKFMWSGQHMATPNSWINENERNVTKSSTLFWKIQLFIKLMLKISSIYFILLFYYISLQFQFGVSKHINFLISTSLWYGWHLKCWL